jgi:hypothetical protein
MQAMRSIVRPKGKSVRLTVPSAFIGLDIEVLAFPVGEPKVKPYDFSDLSGKLEWRGDAVKEQRALRDEW